jgi:hypothetical protein
MADDETTPPSKIELLPTEPPEVSQPTRVKGNRTRKLPLNKTEDLEQRQRDLDIRIQEGRDGRDRSNHWHFWRFRYVLAVFAVIDITIWQYCVFDIVKLQGSGQLVIDTTVLVTLLTTTTINVFAFLIIVMKFVFASTDSK